MDSPVTLVVKTPNQKIQDLQIDCALEWTVKQLKRHLSRVYPTKPVRVARIVLRASKFLSF